MVYTFDIISAFIICIIIITLSIVLMIVYYRNNYDKHTGEDRLPLNITQLCCGQSKTKGFLSADCIDAPQLYTNNKFCCSAREWGELDRNGNCRCNNDYIKDEIVKSIPAAIIYTDTPTFLTYNDKPYMKLNTNESTDPYVMI